MVAVALTSVLGLIVFAYLRSSMDMFARNSAIDYSHASLRSVVDRLSDTLDSADDVPILITDMGATVPIPDPTAAASPWAAGLHFDRFIGEPYVLNDMTVATTLAATTTSLQVVYPVSAVSKVPTPAAGDTLLINVTSGTIRARISSVGAPSSPSTGLEKVTVTLASALGTAVSWQANAPNVARLIRHEAFIVKPGTTGRIELRHYRNFEPMPSDLNAPANYHVVTNQLSTSLDEQTPFRIVKSSGDLMPEINIKIMARDYMEWLATRQTGGFNNFSWGSMRLPSRLRARVQN